MAALFFLHYVADLFENFRSSINPKQPLKGTRYKSLLAATTHYPVRQQRTLLLYMCCGHLRLVKEPFNTTPGSYCVQIGQPTHTLQQFLSVDKLLPTYTLNV